MKNTIKKIVKKINKKLDNVYFMAGVVGIVCLIICLVLYFSGASKSEIIIIVASFVVAVASAFISDKLINKMNKASRYGYREYLLQELEKEKTDNDFEKQKNVTAKPVEVILKTKNDKKDIIALMLNNNDEITEYFKISKRQAKSSYRFSIISCVAGILMLGLAIYGAIMVNDLEIAIIGTVSGAITEVISGTVLWVHNKSALQLNHYYDALHQNEKFLSAINLADKLSDEKREEMYIEIIRRQIEIHKTEKTEVNE